MIERTLTGCTHIEEPDIYQEYVCGYCEFERAQHAFQLVEKLKAETARAKLFEQTLNCFYQICPEKHPYLFATAEDVDCSACELNAANARADAAEAKGYERGWNEEDKP